MDDPKLDRLCDSQARGLRQAAGATNNLRSGYVEGDIDPEGND